MICGNVERPVVRQAHDQYCWLWRPMISIVGFGLKFCWLNMVAVNYNLHYLFVG